MCASVWSGPIVGRANEPLQVDEELPAVRGEGRERLRREVGARQRADVDPFGVADGLDGLLGRPRVPTASCHMIRRSPS